MSKQPDNRIAALVAEIVQLDPALEPYRADLPNLIAALERERPSAVPSETFIADLRAQLLTYKPAPTPTKHVGSPAFFWWAARLAPIGIAIFLLVILTPEQTIAPIETPESGRFAPADEQASPDANETMRTMKTPDQANDDVASTMSLESTMLETTAAPNALTVEPPREGETLTVTSLTIPASGWVVVFEDRGGSFGERLGAAYVVAGDHRDLILTLARALSYPEMVTVAVYTGTVEEQFEITKESLQLDPSLGQPMLVTVPVVSELELEYVE